MPPKRKREPETETKSKGNEQKIIVRDETGKQYLRYNVTISYPDGRTTYTGLPFDDNGYCDATDKAGWKFILQETGYVINRDGTEVAQVKKPRKKGEYVPYDERYPSVTLELGKEYRIVPDVNFPPLSETERLKSYSLAVSCVEYGGRIPPLSDEFPSLLRLAMKPVIKHHEDLSTLAIPEELKRKLEEFKERKQPIWDWITKQIGRPVHRAVDVMRATTEGSIPSWKKFYFPRRPQLLPLPPHLQQSLLLSAIEKGEVGVVAYFRATDRFPGGNADVAIMKYKFFLPQQQDNTTQHNTTQQESESECVVTWSVYHNWDGAPSGFKRSEERMRVSCEKVREGVLSPITKVIKGTGVDVETHVIDTQSDNEEYDTQWSSIEVLVYLPPKILPAEILAGVSPQIGRESFPAPPPSKKKSDGEAGTKNEEKKRKRRRRYTLEEEKEKEDIWVPPNGGPEDQWLLAFRFHQVALLTEARGDNPDKHVDRNLTEGDAQLLVDGVSELLDMGTVESTLDGFNSNPRVEGNYANYDALENVSYAFPVFLYEN